MKDVVDFVEREIPILSITIYDKDWKEECWKFLEPLYRIFKRMVEPISQISYL